jgi:hypothetical protein
MEQPGLIKTIAGYLGKIFVCAFTFTAGLIASRIILNSLGTAMARFPQQAEEAVAGYYLLSGSLILTLGLLPLYGKINGSFSTRFLIAFSFLFVCFGIAVTWENSIYSVVEGSHLMILVLLLPTLLFSLIYTWLSKSPSPQMDFSAKMKEFLESRTITQWLQKALLAILSFPIIYFVFGIMVSPFVMDYYQESNLGLTIPQPGVIVAVQLARSLLFLFVTIPVIIAWIGKRIQLVLFLGLAHFVTVFSYDFVLALQFPIKMELIHGVEIFFDSLIYSWIFVRLFVSKETEK